MQKDVVDLLRIIINTVKGPKYDPTSNLKRETLVLIREEVIIFSRAVIIFRAVIKFRAMIIFRAVIIFRTLYGKC